MSSVDVLYILQNAYQSDKYQFTNDDEWSEALNKSFTGKRLKEMIPENITYRVINANNEIGNNADSCFPANINYIQDKINLYNPRYIVACGRVAQNGVTLLGVGFISAPHPAWRQLSRKKANDIGSKIKELCDEGSI